MADVNSQKRVVELVRKAQEARRRDSNQDAADAVREALSIDPRSEDARKLLEGLSLSGGNPTDVLSLCRDYHEDALSYASFRSRLESSAIDIEGTRETFEFAFEHKGERADRIVEALLDKPNGQRALIPLYLEQPTRTFRALWDLGDASIKALVSKVLLQPGPWTREDDRRKAERQTILLLLAKTLEAGLEKPELSMLAIARLLAVDVIVLHDIVDSDAYVVFFDALNQGRPAALRSQATVVLAKLHEATPENWEAELVTFVEVMAKSRRTERFINVCSVVSTLFPVAPHVCAKMFLREGFLLQLVHLVNDTKSTAFKLAALELFSAACVDSNCREAVKKCCTNWLDLMLIDGKPKGKQSKIPVTAALVQSKIRDDSKGAGGVDDKLVAKLKSIVLGDDASADAKEKAVEGLQYQSVHATVKENLANDTQFLRQLVTFLSQPQVTSNGALTFVGLNIFQNLTRYPPAVSAEQQKIEELKAYASKTPLPKMHSLDEDGPVSDRCTKVLEAGVASLLVTAAKRASLALQLAISSIVLALSKHPRHRGRMAKDGLFDISMAQATIDQDGQPSTTPVKRQASLSFARIMIPIDPNLLMKGRDVKLAVHILLYLLRIPTTDQDNDSDAVWWRGFPVVSALQALTNLATYQPSPSSPSQAADLIVSECWPVLEDLWTSNAIQIRTAVTECFLNLSMADSAAAKFLADEARSERRMRILVGYWSEEEGGLAAAAGGALATLLGAGDQAVELFVKTNSGIQSTVEWLESKKPEMIHRAVVIVSEMLAPVAQANASSELAKRVLEAAKQYKIDSTLRSLRAGGQPWEGQVAQCLDLLKQ